MKFEEALAELRKGKKIHCVSLNTMNLSLVNDEIDMMTFNFAKSLDIIAMIVKGEWFIEEEPGKTFPEVFDAFKSGKKIKRKLWVANKYSNDYITCNLTTVLLSNDDLLATDWEIIE